MELQEGQWFDHDEKGEVQIASIAAFVEQFDTESGEARYGDMMVYYSDKVDDYGCVPPLFRQELQEFLEKTSPVNHDERSV